MPTGKKGKDLRKEKGEALREGKALGGKGGTGPQQGMGGKDLREERGGKILGRKGKGSQPEKRGRILGRKTEKDLRGERP